MTNIHYTGDGKESWHRIEFSKQCPIKGGLIFDNTECQGVEGHEGNHWFYEKDGSFIEWPKEIRDDFGGSSTPPNHKKYINPNKKHVDYYRNHYSQEVVVDPKVISILKSGGFPEDGCSVDRPCTVEEYKNIEDRIK